MNSNVLRRCVTPLLLLLMVAAGCRTPSNEHLPLRISNDNRWLVHGDGTPFFWLGDTAWELFHRLDREEAVAYLEDRSRKGFTVIQAVVLAELDGLNTPNPYGHTPLQENDPTRPEEAYFEHVDYIVDRAQEVGMFIGMLPTWGDKWNQHWGVGPEIFSSENARSYGEFLGRRYGQKPVIWILGGDRAPENDAHYAIIRAMAEGIREGDGGRNLMTFHPWGGRSSSDFFSDEDWLDFNMFQSGHSAYDIPNYEMTTSDYGRTPTKPVIDGEPRYEDHPVNWNPEEGWLMDFDVRQAAYWSMLSGAFGHTYGDHNIWQMWTPDREPISAARTPWQEAMHHPGSAQMGYLRILFESRPWQSLVPDQSVISGDNGEGPAHIRAAVARDGAFLMAYSPYGMPIEIDMDRLSGNEGVAYWFDPRLGQASEIGVSESGGVRQFDPPGDPGRGNDWVLIVEDASRNYESPGTSR